MKRLCWLMVISFSATAQVDSLELLQQQLNEPTSTEQRVELMNKLSHAYTQLSLERAEELASEALQLATRENYQKGMATSYNNLGICHAIRGEYTVGLDCFIKALRIREQLNDLKSTSHTMNNISRLYIQQKEFEKALDYAQQSLELLRKVNDRKAMASAYVSLGAIHMNNQNPKQALNMFSMSRDIFAKEKLRNQEGWALVKMATAQLSDDMPGAALASSFSAMKLLNAETDLFTTLELYETMGSIYTSLDKKQDAMHYLHAAIRMADSGHDSNGRMSSRLALSDAFRKFKQYDSALYYNDAYIAVHTEIFTTEKTRQLATLEKIYQTEKKDQLLELKNQEIRSQSIIISIISVLLAVLAGLGFMIFMYSRDKRRTNIALEKLNREIYEKHEEILAQAEELTQANQEITRINESLENEVTLRTEKIEKQNKMLIEYAYSNAHNVRGPLARILGLTMLMENETDPTLLKEYNRYLHVSALELDQVIGEINSTLQG